MEAFNQTHSAQLQRDVELNEFLIGSWEAFCQHVPVLQRSWATASRTLTQEIPTATTSSLLGLVTTCSSDSVVNGTKTSWVPFSRKTPLGVWDIL